MLVMTDLELLDNIKRRSGPDAKAGPEDADESGGEELKDAGLLRDSLPRPWEEARYPGDDTFDGPKFPARQMRETHFYYIGAGTGSTLRTRVFQKNGSVRPTDAELTAWINAARAGTGGVAIPDFDKLEWHMPGFLIFFIDFPGWHYLEDPADGKNKALHFVEVPARGGSTKRNANYSFCNAVTHRLGGGSTGPEFLVVENHHLRAPLVTGVSNYEHRQEFDDDDDYKFDIYIGMEIEGGGGKKAWFIIDPGGKNMGPP